MISFREKLASKSPEFQQKVRQLKAEMMMDYSLAQLREEMKLSQRDVAHKMDISQPAVCKIENGMDMKLSTLAKYVSALGGSLAVQISLPSGRGVTIPYSTAA